MNKTEKVKQELILNPNRTNREMARFCGCSEHHVQAIRSDMEAAGVISQWRGKEMGVGQKVEDALRHHHERPNSTIAEELGCGQNTVSRVRGRLEADGVIPFWRSLPCESSTYVVRGKKTNLIKIGRSSNLGKRLVDLQTGSPDELEYIAVIPGGELERIIHQRVLQFRKHGEWFEYNDDVRKILLEYGTVSD